MIFSNISYELKNSSGGDILMIDCAGNLYIGSESVYLNTRPPSAPQDGLGILVDGDYNYTFNSTHAYIAGNISGEIADLPTLTSYDILIKNSSNYANLTIFQGLSGNISTRGKAVYVGAEMGSCTQTGETYFSDVCSTGFQLQDNTNTCRSSTYAAGCTGSSQCDGDAPGSCGDGYGTCSSSCSYSACSTGCDGLCSVYSGTCTGGSCGSCLPCWPGYQYIQTDSAQLRKFCKCVTGVYGGNPVQTLDCSTPPYTKTYYKYTNSGDNLNWGTTSVSGSMCEAYRVWCPATRTYYNVNRVYYYPG